MSFATGQSIIPWRAKLAAKMVLARIPLSYKLWRRVGLFRHGLMLDPAYTRGVIGWHTESWLDQPDAVPFSMLELGPGDSLASAALAKLLGCSRSYLVDVGNFATQDVDVYRKLLGGRDCAILGADEWRNLGDVLASTNCTYMTEGLASLREIPSGSVDLIWSHAVLEHVRRDAFADTLCELRRIQSTRGLSSHQIDLRDHLGGRLNNLRFSRDTWEGPLFSGSGFYTNRLRYSEILTLCREAGFEVKVLKRQMWPEVPTPRGTMHREFRELSDDDLRTRGVHLLLHPII